MAAMAMASFPFTNNFSGSRSPILSPDANGDIRADLSADGTPGACPVVLTHHKKVPLPIDLFSDPDQFLRARDRAEPTTLTALTINFDFTHDTTRKAMSNVKVQISNQIQSSNFKKSSIWNLTFI